MSGSSLLATAGRRQVALLGRTSNTNGRTVISATMATNSNSGTNPWETKIISSPPRHSGGNTYGRVAAAAGAAALVSAGAYAAATAAEDVDISKTMATIEQSAINSVENILHATHLQAAPPPVVSSSEDLALVTVHPPLLMALQSMISLGFGVSEEGPAVVSDSSASLGTSQPAQKGTTPSNNSSTVGTEEEGVGFGLRVRKVREFVSAQEWMSALTGGPVTPSSTQRTHGASRQNPDSYEVSDEIRGLGLLAWLSLFIFFPSTKPSFCVLFPFKNMPRFLLEHLRAVVSAWRTNTSFLMRAGSLPYSMGMAEEVSAATFEIVSTINSSSTSEHTSPTTTSLEIMEIIPHRIPPSLRKLLPSDWHSMKLRRRSV